MEKQGQDGQVSDSGRPLASGTPGSRHQVGGPVISAIMGWSWNAEPGAEHGV